MIEVSTPHAWVHGDGPTPCDFMMVGEAPAKNEVRRGVPFCGPVGENLADLAWRIGLPDRASTYITNVIKVPIGDDISDDEMERHTAEWGPLLHAEMDAVRPRVVASLGAWSTRWFLRHYSPGYPDTNDMDWLHGVPRRAIAPWGSFILVPCHHPASGLHDGDSIPYIHFDMAVVRECLLGRKVPVASALRKECIWVDRWPQVEWVVKCREIAVDTEGVPGDVKMASFTTDLMPDVGWVVREPSVLVDFRNFIQRFDGTLIMHNAPWDLKVLASIGLNLYDLRWSLQDTMQMAKYLNTEPGGLKKLAWRLLGLQMDEYDDLIRPIQHDLTIGYLQMVSTMVYPKPESVMTWENGRPRVKKPQGLNQRVHRILRDLDADPTLDVVERWDKVPKEVKKMAVRWWGPMPLADLSHVAEEKQLDYSGTDAIATLAVYGELQKRIKEQYT